ncbi:hypothetical protein GOP47_0021613 [Adiantum capillus-veneris]|uniref:Homeobox domain-containing protein n=1 Tax=Adiantum capillus-veneris TaxID=13818 RepID=A0A9D4U7S5_ADICA|nr:hypothetical protein GOP47_0021613 [Adiantum capillus-veneris]
MFSQPSISPLLPIVDGAAGALARYIQPEDLSLGRKSSDFLSLDLTYSRSGPVSVLRTSKYLKPAQQLLEEFCNVKQETNSTASDSSARSAVLEGAKEISHYSKVESSAAKLQLSAEDRCYLQMRKARLVGMVEELDRRYQRYQDQMQLIITSFESATGMSAAVPYTALARKLISRQFRALRDAIGEHIKVACRSLGDDISSVPVLNKGETPRLRILDQRLRHHRTLQQVGMLHQTQSWRPQRGLPERSVAVLRAWLFEHFLHPYPKDSEKLMLARLTGLTRSQVANWFINARVRLWKPMVEQMYAEESKENEFQDAAEGSVAVQNGQLDHMDYTGSDGHFGKGDMVQAKDNSGARHNHDVENSEHLSYNSGNSTMSYNRMMTPRHGVSLTLGLQHSSSSTEFPLHPNYNPNQHFNVQAASAEDVNYTFV